MGSCLARIHAQLPPPGLGAPSGLKGEGPTRKILSSPDAKRPSPPPQPKTEKVKNCSQKTGRILRRTNRGTSFLLATGSIFIYASVSSTSLEPPESRRRIRVRLISKRRNKNSSGENPRHALGFLPTRTRQPVSYPAMQSLQVVSPAWASSFWRKLPPPAARVSLVRPRAINFRFDRRPPVRPRI